MDKELSIADLIALITFSESTAKVYSKMQIEFGEIEELSLAVKCGEIKSSWEYIKNKSFELLETKLEATFEIEEGGLSLE